MPIQSETELYAPVKAYWEQLGYEVRGEVRHCDLVAVREGEAPVIVELKRSLTVPLLIQGLRRQDVTEQVYIAIELPAKGRVPHRMTWGDIRKLCGRLGLGLITVQFYKTKKPAVDIVCDPPGLQSPVRVTPARKRKADRLLGEFRERSADYNVGGSTRRKLVTAYREKALHCALLLRQQGPLSPRKLRELTGNAKTAALLQRNVYGWFARVNRGVYSLTPQGAEALAAFAHVVAPLESASVDEAKPAGTRAAAARPLAINPLPPGLEPEPDPKRRTRGRHASALLAADGAPAASTQAEQRAEGSPEASPPQSPDLQEPAVSQPGKAARTRRSAHSR
ncbi:DUF2161 domain-containing phosphodiesterase [Paenibacillus sp. FJAT-26967]|uniref:DUF2161 domain-containing phosphodiesterase n=1 Tax=Paenibacillus sp. FJAT-26967 TaxID=1729690 RepID=UPI000A3F36D1